VPLTMAVGGYAATALGAAVLSFVIAAAAPRSPLAKRFLVAALATTTWGLLNAVWTARSQVPLVWGAALEILKNGAWILALVGFGSQVVSRFLRLFSYAACLVLIAYVGLSPVLVGHGLDLDMARLSYARASLALSLLGLIVLEQIYRNSVFGAQRQLRFLVIGVGGLFAYDLFMYSQAELLRGLELGVWEARGYAAALLIPMIAMALRRLPGAGVDIFVSRHIVFYTGAIFGIGAYFAAMALGGYYVRFFGGEWGAVLQAIFFVAALAGLLFLAYSLPVRRYLRVFISKHFYRNKYDYREEWLRFIETLSQTHEADVYRTSLRAIAQILSSPGGMLFTLDDDGRRLVAMATENASGAELPTPAELPLTDPLARLLADRQWIVDVAECRQNPGEYWGLSLPPWLAQLNEAWIVSPLLDAKRLIGFLVLLRPPPPVTLTYEDRDLLKTVGRHVATLLLHHDVNRKLAQSRQFEAYNRLTAFMMHDLKNSVAQLELVVANAERHRQNPRFFDDAIDTVRNAVERLRRLIEQLKGAAAKGNIREVALEGVIRVAAARCQNEVPVPVLPERFPAVHVWADGEQLATGIEHVIRNAQDATPESGTVQLRVHAVGSKAIVSVVDSGCGMSTDFVRTRLFQPFESTKDAKGMGMGAYQVREYVRTIGGDVEVQSEPGQGTTFSIILPTAVARHQLDAERSHPNHV
jgi:putative PEP-CTERM system histidine kinase